VLPPFGDCPYTHWMRFASAPLLWRLSAGLLALLAVGCAELLELDEFAGRSTTGNGGAGAGAAGRGGRGGGKGGAAGGGGAPACVLDASFEGLAPVPVINSPAAERSVFLSADQLIIYFSSKRVIGVDALDELWWATRNSIQDDFSPPTKLANVNSTQDDFFPSLSGDRLTLIFGSTRSGAQQTDLYVATRTHPAVDFDTPQSIAGVNSSDNEFGSFVLPDLSALYLFSNRTGDYDIFRSPGLNGSFGAPVAVDEVNLPTSYEGCPVVSPDELTLYFYTTRQGGPPDIWVTQRSQVGAAFAPPTKVDELCSSDDDRPGWLSPDGCTLYLMTDRPGGSGSLDIWVAHRPQ